MITVYVWRPESGNVGHAAAQIGERGQAGSAYVSWWPDGDWKQALPGAANTYERDRRAEGREADATRLLHGLDEPGAAAWWTGFQRGTTAHYQAAGQNCSWAVIQALKASGADNYIAWHDTHRQYNAPLFPHPLLCTVRFGLGLRDYRNREVSQGMEFVDSCTAIWTPVDVLKYCDAVLSGQRSGQGSRTGQVCR